MGTDHTEAEERPWPNLTRDQWETVLSDAFGNELLHVWPYPDPPDDYWTHILDANSRHKLARVALDCIFGPASATSPDHSEVLRGRHPLTRRPIVYDRDAEVWRDEGTDR